MARVVDFDIHGARRRMRELMDSIADTIDDIMLRLYVVAMALDFETPVVSTERVPKGEDDDPTLPPGEVN